MNATARAVRIVACVGLGSLLGGCGLLLDFDREDIEEVDAGSTPDGGADGGTGCSRAEDCADDGKFCTEAECQGGQCVHTALDCDDGVECTDESCDENARRCVIVPQSDRCEDDEICSAEKGCIIAPKCDDPDDCNFNDDVCDGIELCNDEGRCDLEPPPDPPIAIGCLTATCDPVDGWMLVATDSMCNDPWTCTDNVCEQNGICSFLANADACDDGVDCTEDRCAPDNDRHEAKTGCIHVPRDLRCPLLIGCKVPVCDPTTGCGSRYDLEFCLPEEYCGRDGVCTFPASSCEDDDACNDNDPCNGTETCGVDGCVPDDEACPEPGEECLEAFCLDSGGFPVCGTRVTERCFPGIVPL